MTRAILFDCFGVLYPDTYWTLARRHLGEQFSEYYQELHDLVTKVDLGFITRDELWGQFAEIIGSNKEAVYEELKELGGLDTRLLRFIEQYKSTHKIGMISNVGHGFIERMFTDKPVEYYFDDVVLSSDVGLVKPDSKIYQLAASRLECAMKECIFIDDIQKNVDGAINAGMQALLYKDYETFIQDISEILKVSDSNK